MDLYCITSISIVAALSETSESTIEERIDDRSGTYQIEEKAVNQIRSIQSICDSTYIMKSLLRLIYSSN